MPYPVTLIYTLVQPFKVYSSSARIAINTLLFGSVALVLSDLLFCMKTSHSCPLFFPEMNIIHLQIYSFVWCVINTFVTQGGNTQVFLTIFSWSPSSGQNYKLQVFFTFHRLPKAMKLHTHLTLSLKEFITAVAKQ